MPKSSCQLAVQVRVFKGRGNSFVSIKQSPCALKHEVFLLGYSILRSSELIIAKSTVFFLKSLLNNSPQICFYLLSSLGDFNQVLSFLLRSAKFVLQIVSAWKVSWNPPLPGQLGMAIGFHDWEESRKYSVSWGNEECIYDFRCSGTNRAEAGIRIPVSWVATAYNLGSLSINVI